MGTSIANGATVRDCSLPINRRTFVVCPCGLTEPVIVVTMAVNGDWLVVTVGAKPRTGGVMKVPTGEYDVPAELIATSL